MLYKLIMKDGGYVYVCGDGAHMAQDVQLALSDILQEHGDMSAEQANGVLSMLEKRQRLVKDVWS